MSAQLLLLLLLLSCVIQLCTSDNSFHDWLVHKIDLPSRVRSDDSHLVLTNGLVTRKFALKPAFAAVDIYSHEKKSSLLRAVGPEAVIRLDGHVYPVGGISSNISRAYLNRTAFWERASGPLENSFLYTGFSTSEPVKRYNYVTRRGAPDNIAWPPKGVHLMLHFRAPIKNKHQNVHVTVHYEIYDGIPLFTKWLTIDTNSLANEAIKVSILSVDQLSLNWQWSTQGYNWLQVSTDEPHGTVVRWSQEANVDFGSFQPLLNCIYDRDFDLVMGESSQQNTLTSFRVFELLVGSSDQERVGLAQRRMLRALAPQVQENPIYFHVNNASSSHFRKAVDQLAEVGFEMIFYSFGSGFNLEADDIEQLKTDIAYANSKGIEVGGYDLIAWTRKVPEKWRALTTDVTYSACFASGWYDYLLDKVRRIVKVANLTAIETDGPYFGYSCGSEKHKHHLNERDSVYHQNRLQSRFFMELHSMGMYVNQPDTYFFQGANKEAMGYNEGQFSLPRWRDLSISRQGMFDDTFTRMPSQGWMFLPIQNYNGGGPPAWFAPLSSNLQEYNWALAQYFGAGVQACYRGDFIYDTDETKMVVKQWVAFFKKYRTILNGDIIHARRPDMQSIDAYLHVRPHREDGPYRGLAFFFNPTNDWLSDEMSLPLYYTGLSKTAVVSLEGKSSTSTTFVINRDYSIDIPISLKPQSFTWVVIE